MRPSPLVKWHYFTAEMILCAVRWYPLYKLSDRDVEELMRERGVAVDHPTICRWVQRYVAEVALGRSGVVTGI